MRRDRVASYPHPELRFSILFAHLISHLNNEQDKPGVMRARAERTRRGGSLSGRAGFFAYSNSLLQ